MSEQARLSERRPGGSLGSRIAGLPSHPRAPFAIVIVQAAWMWWVFSRGWFLQSDLANLVDALGQRPTWAYLSSTLDGQFSPITRFVYWLMDEVSPLDYGLAIALRLGCQAASTLVLYRLLLTLVPDRRLVTAIVAVYALNPMLVAGTAMFTPGITIGLGQLLTLLAIQSHVRFERTRRIGHEFVAGVLLALALLCSEQWAVAAAVFPLLSLVHAYQGGFTARLRTLLRNSLGWLLLLTPIVVAAAVAVLFGDPAGATPSVSASYRLLRNSWLYAVGPSWVGGPIEWYAAPDTYFGFASPSDLAVILGQLAVAATVVLGLRRGGRASLLGWLIPVVCWVASTLLIGYRGVTTHQTLIAITPRYFAALVPLFAIGATLALSPRPPQRIAAQELPEPGTADTGHDRRARTVVGGLVAAVVAASVVSGLRFGSILGRQRADVYVDNLRTSAQLAGQRPNVYDTALPAWLIASVEPQYRVTDLLRLLGVRATVADTTSEPLVAAPDGRLTRASFVPAAQVVRQGRCGSAVNGKGTFTFPLNNTVAPVEWWLRLELFQSKPSTVRVQLAAADGRVSRPVNGEALQLTRLEAVNLRLPAFATAAVRIISDSDDTHLCLASIQVGAPFPAPGP